LTVSIARPLVEGNLASKGTALEEPLWPDRLDALKPRTQAGGMTIRQMTLEIQVALNADTPRRQRPVAFVELPDGSWASNAVLAVRRGRGRAIYPEAIHFSVALGRQLEATRASQSAAMAPLRVNPFHLRPFRGLPGHILDWLAGQEPAGTAPGLVPDADLRFHDQDWVSDRLGWPTGVAGAASPAGGKPFGQALVVDLDPSVETACRWLRQGPIELLVTMGELWAQTHDGLETRLAGHRCPRRASEIKIDTPRYDRAWVELEELLARPSHEALWKARRRGTAAGSKAAIRRLGDPRLRALPHQEQRAVVAFAGIWTGLLALRHAASQDPELAQVRSRLLAPVYAVFSGESTSLPV
jgi:hypothetical protein